MQIRKTIGELYMYEHQMGMMLTYFIFLGGIKLRNAREYKLLNEYLEVSILYIMHVFNAS